MVRREFLIGLALAGLVAGTAAASAQQKAAPAKAPAKAAAAAPVPAGPVGVFEFTKGIVEIEFSPTEAPQGHLKIIGLIRQGFYRGQRIWYNSPSLVEWGDPTTRDMTKRDGWGTVGSGKPVGVDEVKLAKRKFVRGTVGFGHRTGYKAATADSYMFVIKGSNTAADGVYAVLGRVVTGIEVVDKLELNDRIVNAYMKGEKK
jgi:cyclophilin family peptidyl-prolyl cis-trans isomerase